MTTCREETTGDDEIGESGSTETSASTETSTDTETSADTETGGPECGNGEVEGDEQCDDGNDIDDDDCTNTCTSATCGDGIMQPGEGCDAGADNGPGKPCNSMCQPNTCGDGEIGPGEGCDDGNTIDDDECSNECALQTCGNGSLDPGEACDDGNTSNDDECLNTCVMASCGDGVLFEQHEDCDDGAQNSDAAACTSSCQQAVCGDGLVWADMEACDLGPANGPMSACLDDCIENVCGDGFQGPQEGCDDGNLTNDDGCTANCVLEGCGDGVAQAGEACDDGNFDNTDDCTTLCQLPACGDGFVQMDEQCDQGNANANDADCTLQCTDAACGDGLLHAFVEQCDNGIMNANDAACKLDCTDNYCGDGFAGPGESCDDGNIDNTDACTSVCATATCGDGFVQMGEQCDDDNPVNDDGCTNACTLPACSDGILQAGEACDNGMSNGANAPCNPECAAASCGDGYVYAMGGEVCDDGNLVTADACTNACMLATCGDGIVHIGVETCDDANASNTDSCIGTCQTAICGDGYVWANNEACDDGNLQNGDGCEANCMPSVGTKKIVHGVSHSCMLTWSGNVKCWGGASLGQLGRGNTNHIGDNELPSSIGFINFGGGTVADIEVGGYHTCALMNDNTLRCWGYNLYGQLGYGHSNNIGDNEGPGGVVAVGANVAAFRLGIHHTCVLTDQQAVRCWGFNGAGQLGYGNTNNIGDNELPSSVGTVSVGGPVAALYLSGNNAYVRLQNGDIRGWGENVYGQLGLGNIVGSMQIIGDNELPSSVGPLDLGNAPIAKLAIGTDHGCALYVGGTMRCWGGNGDGQLGYGHTNHIGDNEVALSVGLVDVGGVVDDIVLGWHNTCVRMGTEVKCWGYGLNGQNGYASTATLGDGELPSSYGAINLGMNVTHLVRNTDGRYHCAMNGTTLRCWGFNSFGQLGYGNVNNIGDNETPASAGNVSY